MKFAHWPEAQATQAPAELEGAVPGGQSPQTREVVAAANVENLAAGHWVQAKDPGTSA